MKKRIIAIVIAVSFIGACIFPIFHKEPGPPLGTKPDYDEEMEVETRDEPNPTPSRYYVEADSEEMAKEIAEAANAKLISYDEGIAIMELKLPLGSFIEYKLTGESPFEETVEVVVDGNDSIINEDGYSTTIYQDSIYYTDEKIAPEANEFYDLNIWDMNAIEWKNTYKNNITGQGAVVAVLDTGCAVDHKDLSENIIGTYNAADGSANVADRDGHGTHVAGIIAARDNTRGICGVAPDARLYIMKVESDDGYMWDSNIIRAMNKCVELGNINVINMSLGGPTGSKLFSDAMTKCMNAGILCVSAAGNEATNVAHYPAAFQIGLSVAAYMSYTGELYKYSNYGINSNIAAPGCSIYSTYPANLSSGSGTAYQYLTGTSMATPFISGIAALVYSSQPISKDIIGSTYVKNVIINSNNGKYYSIDGHSVYGGVSVQNIFRVSSIKKPSKPKITVKEQTSTKQQLVTIEGSGDIYYTTDGSTPSIYSTKYTGKIHLDKKGNTVVKAISVNKRSYSNTISTKVTVASGVISQAKLNSVEIYINDKGTTKLKAGATKQLKIKNNGKTIDVKKFKWSSSNTKIAKVDDNGKVTINSKAKSGKSVTIKAKLGSVTKKFIITVK